MIVQNIGQESLADISFTVPNGELKDALRAVNEAATLVGASGVTHDDSVAKISVVGLGMARQTGVAQKMFEALAEAGINIQMITTSEIKISVLVKRSEAQAALRAVHQVFQLHQKPDDAKVWQIGQKQSSELSASEIIERLRNSNMEQLTLLDISLVGDQARVTLSGVPDTPGLAERVFKEVAKAGVFVDMIVQSCDGFQGETSISFTVPEEQMDHCLQVLKEMDYKFRKVTGSKDIAKLSVSGIGLRSHTSVAIAMFNALSDAEINVLMINTSELRVNVVIDGKDGPKGLACLQKTFESSLV
jgi:aspartate kinase